MLVPLVVLSSGLLTVSEVGRWRLLSRRMRQSVDERARFLVEQQAWGLEAWPARHVHQWQYLQRSYAHWFCRCCQQLVPAGLWGQWRGEEYVAWCLGCHVAVHDFLPPLHPPELPWGSVPHYSQQEPLHFLKRVLRAYQRDEGEPAAHHDDTQDQVVQLLAV